jgi:gamma-glutamylcyclotransferase
MPTPTDNEQDIIYGALFEICPAEKHSLDRAEGLGYGYGEKEVTVMVANSEVVNAISYIAINIDKSLLPYSWYVEHVLIVAKETFLPKEYIQVKIKAVETLDDKNKERDEKERAIHS